VLLGPWLEEGMYISNVLPELDAAALARVDLTVLNQPPRDTQACTVVVGSPPDGHDPLVYGSSRGSLDEQHRAGGRKTRLLSELIAGKGEGRTDDQQITFFNNNAGTGIQFAAAGAALLARLKEQKIEPAKQIPTEWFLQNIPC
jgi:ornithine cyclodeaminase/alanine dehydrogenase-like protein (mu-crystallin family)